MHDGNLNNEDVFLSYAREDERRATQIAQHLRDAEISVFQDISMRSGTNWLEVLDAKIKGVKLVLVLWSQHSVKSNWVHEEASAGKGRQALLAVRLDATRPPLGFGTIQTADMRTWSGDVPPPAMGDLIAQIRELITDDGEAASGPADRTAKPGNQRGYSSVSKREEDCADIVATLPGNPEAQVSIEKGYGELQSAVDAARNNPNDQVPPRFYAAAAQHFADALAYLSPQEKAHIVRHGRPIEYFLLMERANCLARCEPTPTGDPRQEAVEILTRLSKSARYRQDAPVHFRLGEALSRASSDYDTMTKASRALERARKIVNDDDEAHGVKDKLLSEGLWLHAEIARLLGTCNYRMSRNYTLTVKRRRNALDTAIDESRRAVSLDDGASDGDSVYGETAMRSRGNLIYMLAERIRDDRVDTNDLNGIREQIEVLRTERFQRHVQNQVQILDDIAYGAVTIGDWQTAFDEAERIIQMLEVQAASGNLSTVEQVVDARAREIYHLARLALRERERIKHLRTT